MTRKTPTSSAWRASLDDPRGAGNRGAVPTLGTRLPRAVILLGITSLFTDVATEMIFPLLPVLIASLGGGATFLGLIEGLADAISSLLKLASGYVAERTGKRKPLVVAGYAVASLVRPFVAVATAPWHVLVVRVSDRVGKGLRSSPRDAMIAAAVPRDQAGRAFGFHNAMDHAGAVVGPVLATLLLGAGLSLRHVFWVAALPGALALIAVLLVSEPSDSESSTPEAPVPAKAPSVDAAPPGVPVPAAAVRLPPNLKTYCAILAVFSLGGSSDAFLILRARDAGVAVRFLPLLWAFLNLSKLVSSLFAGALSDRVARVRLIVLGWFVYAGTYLGFAWANAPWQAWALFAVYGMYYGLTEPVEKALVRDITTSAERSRAYGVYNFVIGAAALPAGLLTGALWQTWGPGVALGVGAALAAAAALALSIWARSLPSVVGGRAEA
jgi:MFS family permease